MIVLGAAPSLLSGRLLHAESDRVSPCMSRLNYGMLYVQSLHVCHNCIMACCMYSLSMYVTTELWHAVCTVSPCMSQLNYGMLYVIFVYTTCKTFFWG